MTAERLIDHPIPFTRSSSFADWRGRLDREQILPIIAVAGSRGKTSVLRAVESIFRVAGHRFASWTDRGVEIEGERQRGELGPWSRALTRLKAGGLDVALQETDWTTVQTIGSPDSPYALAAVVNLCANNEACLVTPETFAARKALARLQESVSEAGRLILNADDFAVSEVTREAAIDRCLVGFSPDTPVLRRHLYFGGDAVWVANNQIVMREGDTTSPIADLRDLRWTRDGDIPLAVQNALFASAIARSCGTPHEIIGSGLAAHDPRPETMPGSFNVFETGSATIIVDRPTPSWFLRASLRATANLGPGRPIRAIGPMLDVATDDLSEVGRLLGRAGGVLIVHGAWTPDRLDQLRQGAASNDVPPIILQSDEERAAVQQGLGMLRPGDVMFVLAEDPTSVVKLLDRRLRRLATLPDSVGAA